MVAGEIAAALGNGEGIAGLGLSARLLIAKVVGPDGTISLEAEARAIRWAVDRGARVINLSLGGPRDPVNPERDTYSQLEQDAIDYAYARGAVIVAATGNCEAVCPYAYASYPAALPHVVGVGALDRDGRVPRFSNRDVVFTDMVAPGVGVVSTFPRALTVPGCEPIGYSLCAPIEYRRGEGTSFAAPLVSAAAAILRALRPGLGPNQVMAALGDSAIDLSRLGRDAKTGRGLLDVSAAVAALSGVLPRKDALEANDVVGDRSARIGFASGQATRRVRAALDYFDDRLDVYSIELEAGVRIQARLRGGGDAGLELSLWSPRTMNLASETPLARVEAPDGRGRIGFSIRRTGVHYVAVRVVRGGRADYELELVRSRP
jgi:subtilisin family serine protease